MNESFGFNPSATLDRLRQEFEGMLDRMKSNGEKTLETLGIRPGKYSVAVDLWETAEDVFVRADLPGLDATAVEVLLLGNMLTLRGKRTNAEANPSDVVHLKERPYGDFERVLPLPSPVDPAQVSAQTTNGVLTIRLPKKESAKPHPIKIQTGSSPASQAGM
ncbi:MAG: Hsp20/alpha crystallin family protein [Planctomycetales bacterium]